MDMNEKPKLLKKIKPVSNISNFDFPPPPCYNDKKEVTPHDQ